MNVAEDINKNRECSREVQSNQEKQNNQKMQSIKKAHNNIEEQSDREELTNNKGIHQGHKWVDLGLSVKWATCNLGAIDPGTPGTYYSWGETSPKPSYTEENCRTTGKLTGDISGDRKYDAARKEWGGEWRIPTIKEYEELIERCRWIWTSLDGRKGYRVTGSNGNSIFIPASGWICGKDSCFTDEGATLWSSTPHYEKLVDAQILGFTPNLIRVGRSNRHNGRCIRPVL